ncbi:TPA: hypothetical protein R9Y59_000183 [Stenotrophomonas maltophilia]|nr:hypothetical protein [Stenotrophomonas maltophilia]HEF1870153.1 hypothetical protein [Stenotrophomonas maltophilia]HEF1890523.1 hypothetical protein [Stenotrophomonas maltophilia]
MSDIQRERELRRLEASLRVDRGAEGNSTTEPAPVIPERVMDQAKPVMQKVAEASQRIIKQTTEAADNSLKGLPNITLSRARKKSLYICVGAVLLTGAGIIAFNLMRDKSGSAAPAPAIAIAPPQGLYIPPVTNQVPGRVQEEERKPVEHPEQAMPQELPAIEEAPPLEPAQPPRSSVDEDNGSAQNAVPAQVIAPAPAAAPRAIQRYQPPPASDKEIKAEVERVEAGKPWQSKIDQIKELDL